MSFFEKPPKPIPHNLGPSGPSSQPRPGGAERGNRVFVQRPVLPEGYRNPAEIEAEEVATPEHRKTKGKKRVKDTAIVDRLPEGCLFRVELKAARGFFDLLGYWVTWKSRHEFIVRRGAPRFVMKQLTPLQRKELERVRLNARRQGLR